MPGSWNRSRNSWWIWTCTVASLLLLIGIAELWLLDVNNGLVVLQRDAFLQLGALGLICSASIGMLATVSPELAERVLKRQRGTLPKLMLSLVIFAVVGETALRIVFWNGTSFSDRSGPMQRRFERDFQFNRYENSRGPELSADVESGSTCILVQGDSITWGQGVRDESELWPARLLAKLRHSKRNVEMAVIARPGREIDGHYQQLLKFGEQIRPHIIVYQWFVNDMEIGSKTGRPGRQRRHWPKPFFHRLAARYSYLWSFASIQLEHMCSQPQTSYEDYILETFGPDTEQWRRFADEFGRWAQEAKRLTPNVVIALYPLASTQSRTLNPIHTKVARLCRGHGIHVIDLGETLDDVRTNREIVSATPYDAHPSAAIHARIAADIYRGLAQRWPGLLRDEQVAKRGGGATASAVSTP